MTAPAWGRLFTPGSGAAGSRAVERLPRFLTSWEDWLTFVLVGVALFAVVVSIEQANWVREMPSLAMAALVGLLSGWVISHLRGSQWLLHLGGLGIGLVLVFGEVMHTMRLSDPVLQGGARDRWTELWARNREWADALVSGGVSSDPLPFVLLMVFMVWGLTYTAAWAVFRWRSPWLALVPGGFVLLTNISYLPGQPAREFVIFLFAAVLLFSRLQLLRTAAAAAGRVRTPPFLSLEVLNASWWIGLALVIAAWAPPTGNNLGPVSDALGAVLAPITDRVDGLGRLFVGVNSKRGRDIHSFSDVLPLQGKVSLSDLLLMRVTAAEPLYLRSASFDEYGLAGWQVSDADRDPLPGTTVAAAEFGTPQTRAQFRRPVTVTVELVEEPANNRRLLVAGDPLAADVRADAVVGAAPADVLGLRPDGKLDVGDTYTTVGSVSAATVDRLTAAGQDYPQWVRDRYLQLPGDLPAEVAELAAQVTRAAQAPYLRARLVEQFLRANYPYALDIPDPPPRADPVAYFLFTERRGYFDYHASAMAVLLRAVGVPARVAVGFALDDADLDTETKAYLVSEERAWAWTEVFFPGFGWVEFNPTPGRALIARPGDDAQFLESIVGLDDSELDPDSLDFVDEELFGGGAFSDDAGAAFADGGNGIGGRVAAALSGLLMVTLAALVAAVAVRLLWERGFRGLSLATGRWAKLQHLAGWAGAGSAPHRTPLEAAADLRGELALSHDLTPLARAYTRERYGPARPQPAAEPAPTEDAPADPEADKLGALYVAARNDLLRDTLRRWFRRPRRR